MHWHAEQLVPDGATHEVDLHAHMLTEARARAFPRLAGAALADECLDFQDAKWATCCRRAGPRQLLRARKPHRQLIANPSTDGDLKSRLEPARDARDFASRELALPDNRSYRSYSALGRDYVVWNVVAAPEFSVAPKRWWFPITGSIAYRGYFREATRGATPRRSPGTATTPSSAG